MYKVVNQLIQERKQQVLSRVLAVIMYDSNWKDCIALPMWDGLSYSYCTICLPITISYCP